MDPKGESVTMFDIEGNDGMDIIYNISGRQVPPRRGCQKAARLNARLLRLESMCYLIGRVGEMGLPAT